MSRGLGDVYKRQARRRSARRALLNSSIVDGMKKRTPDKVSFVDGLSFRAKAESMCQQGFMNPPAGQGLGGSLLESRFSDTDLP